MQKRKNSINIVTETKKLLLLYNFPRSDLLSAGIKKPLLIVQKLQILSVEDKNAK